MVANYSGPKRKFDSYRTPEDALAAARKLARQLNSRDAVAAGMTNSQAIDYAAATQALAPFGLSLASVATTVAGCLLLVGDLPTLHAAAKFYAQRNRQVTQKAVKAVVEELIAVKTARNASERYVEDLKSRLNRFADSFAKDAGNVSTADIQAWLDSQKLGPQNYANFRRVIHLLFEFAVARGYAIDNPASKVETIKIGDGEIEIFTPAEIKKLLTHASEDFLPCLAIGAFAGMRSAEIERLEWADIHFADKCIIVGAGKAKSASRRVVPISDNLSAWLAGYSERKGLVWKGDHESFYDEQQTAAKLAGVKWKSNALRHSYASYRAAQIGDAGRVAAELGNSAAIVHRHYRELVKSADAEKWFSIVPVKEPKIIQFSAQS